MAEYSIGFLTAAVATECMAACACSSGAKGQSCSEFPKQVLNTTSSELGS